LAREGGVRLVPARTEHGAAAMADATPELTGRLAAVVTSTGVGAGNAAGSLLEAYSASSPVIHVTGQVEAAFVEGDKGFLHGVKDQLGMLERVGKAAYRAQANSEENSAMMRAAMSLARSGRPGLYQSKFRSISSIAQSSRTPTSRSAACTHEPDPSDVARGRDAHWRSPRALIWAGGGVISAHASAEWTALAERSARAWITTAAGRGALPRPPAVHRVLSG